MEMPAATDGMPHMEHDHSAHAGASMEMSHDHGAVQRRADGSYYYTHGAFLGHIVPGTFFLLWGLWWLIATYHAFITSNVSRQKKFTSKASHAPWFGPSKLQQFPVEPVVKIVLPFFGILGELWLGHGPQYQPLYLDDGKFNIDGMNDWQHSAMYSAFIVSGLVDLLATKMDLPTGTQHGFLFLAFLSEGILLAFHLKGPPIEVMLHLILVIQIFATAVAILAETISRSNLVVAALRPILTIVQGVWWIQTAYFMYRSIPAWDPEYMGSAMFAPVVFVMDLVWLSAGALAILVVMRFIYSRAYDNDIPFTALKSSGYENGNANGSLYANGSSSYSHQHTLGGVHSLDDEEQGVLELTALETPPKGVIGHTTFN